MHALIVTTDGVEDREFSYPYYRLQEAEADVRVATPEGEVVQGKRGAEFEADLAVGTESPEWFAEEFHLSVVPGGRAPERLREAGVDAAAVVGAFVEAGVPVAAVGHGLQTLVSADVLEGREVAAPAALAVDVENAGATVVDEAVSVDEGVVTAGGPASLPGFVARALEVAEGPGPESMPA